MAGGRNFLTSPFCKAVRTNHSYDYSVAGLVSHETLQPFLPTTASLPAKKCLAQVALLLISSHLTDMLYPSDEVSQTLI